MSHPNKSAVVSIIFLIVAVYGDLYLQTPPGSNNRLEETGRDRYIANRLFDSQNNNRGGYNIGHMTYYTGEIVPIAWTNRDGSGKYQLKETEIILQYSCDPLMRDGTTTNRIPDNPDSCQDYDCDTDVEYGRHESWESYQYCKATSRNKGLFTANQRLNNNEGAIFTRQDYSGTRYGYECPEERDYYPYWRQSMWRDIAIYTNTVERCEAYQEESFNVKDREGCVFTDEYWDDVLMGYVPNGNMYDGILPLDQYSCENNEDARFVSPKSNETLYAYEWKIFENYDIDPPECKETRTTRVNHHGTPGDRTYWTHYWTVPDEILDIDGHDQCCVIRARYNITTDDYQAWENDYSIGAGLNYMNNSYKNNPNPDDDPAWVKIWENFGLTYDDIQYSFYEDVNGDVDYDDEEQKWSRGYVFRNDPEVDPFGYDPMGGNGITEQSRILLQLAINTDQFGRTFQDRTHCFTVKDRKDAGIDDNLDIALVTVQGKRGNIVQVYPATPYFFVPEPVNVTKGSYVHFCWTGSNNNPDNNDGEGLAGSDRSNICPLTQQQWDKYAGDNDNDTLGNYGDVDGYWEIRENGAVGDPGNNYPDWLKEPEGYTMPQYYNYAPKRDLARKRGSFDDYDLDEYPYNDPYNKFWFSERGDVSPMAGLDIEVLSMLCGGSDRDGFESIDNATTTFCIEPVKVEKHGYWNFLSTRNNNFGNRFHKGSIVVVGNASEEIQLSTTTTMSPMTTMLSMNGTDDSVDKGSKMNLAEIVYVVIAASIMLML